MIALPGHAYVPGQSPRHAEGTFDAIRNTAKPEMGEAELARSDAFQHGLTYLDAGYFWEAHEVLEPVWMALPDGDARRFVQGLIQLANALLKERMNRPKAARRLAAIARDLIHGNTATLGIPPANIISEIDALEGRLPE